MVDQVELCGAVEQLLPQKRLWCCDSCVLLSPYKLVKSKPLYGPSLTFVCPFQNQNTEVCLVYTQSAQVYGRHLFSVRVTVFSSLWLFNHC